MSKLTDDQIQTMINHYIREQLQRMEDDRIKYYSPIPLLKENQEWLEGDIEDVLWDLQEGQYGTASYKVFKLLKKENIHLEEDSFEFNKICRELLKAQLKFNNVELKRNIGDYSDDVDALFPIPSVSTVEQTDDSKLKGSSITLEELKDDYFAENIRAGNWSERTQIEYKSIFKNIINLFGNVSVNEIDHAMVQNVKQILLCLPRNYFKATKKYENIPITDFLKNEPEEKLSVKTVNKYLDNIKALFNFAITSKKCMQTNYAEGLKIRIRGKAYKERDVFSNEDLTALFSSKKYINDTFDQPWKFWLPILGLYTGCRIEEICQLTIEDIKQLDGIWVFEIKEEVDSDQKTKTESSNRFVPLHPLIINDLNFPKYVKRLKEEGGARLFPELKKQSGRYGHYPSRWFGKYKKLCGIVAAPNKKVFHSFRHNVQDNLKQQLISDTLVDELVGHVIQGESRGRYGKPYRVKILYENAVMKLKYNIDLSHLKSSKYVIQD